jgi:hypothetical protein
MSYLVFEEFVNPLNFFFLFSIFIPVYCLCFKRYEILVGWLALSASIEIFNNLMFVTFSATKFAGIILLPYALKSLKEIINFSPVKLWLSLFGILICTGIIYGFFSPWPNYFPDRPIRQLSSGRSVLFLGSYFLEMMVIVFLAKQLHKKNMINYLLWGLIIGGLLTTSAILIEKFFEIDFYYLFTGYDPRDIQVHRHRGFNYEPRGAGYSIVVALLMTLIMKIKFKYKVLLILFLLIGFNLAASVSSAIIFIMTYLVILLSYFFFRKRLKDQMKVYLQCGASIIIIHLIYNLPLATYLDKGLQHYKLNASVPVQVINDYNTYFTTGKIFYLDKKGLYFSRFSNDPLLSLKKANELIEKGTFSKEVVRLNSWDVVYKAKERAYLKGMQTIVNYPVKQKHLLKFEAFDAGSIDFFITNPKHLVFGVGPGLIGLASTTKDFRVDSLPHIGLVYLISNYGLVGFIIFSSFILICLSRLLERGLNNPNQNNNLLRLSTFVSLIICYGIQVKIFYIFAFGIALSTYVNDKIEDK